MFRRVLSVSNLTHCDLLPLIADNMPRPAMSIVCDAAPLRPKLEQPEEEDVLARAREKLITCWRQILLLIDPDEAISIIFLILSSNQLLTLGYKLCQQIIQGHSKEALEQAVTLVLHGKGHLNTLLKALYLIGRYDILEDYLDLSLNQNDPLHQKLQLPCSLSLDRKALYLVCSGLTQNQVDQFLVPRLQFKKWSVPEQGRPLEETFIRNLQPGNYSKLINEIYQDLKEIKFDNLASHLDLFITSEHSIETNNDDTDFYPSAYQHPYGLCVIINVKDFIEPHRPQDQISLNKRHGSDIDQERLTGTFKLFGFEIIHLNNPSYEEIMQFFKNLHTNQALHTISCLAVCVMTHGDGVDNIYLHDRTSISVTDLRKLCFCDSLINKPRIFFVQACRGEKTLPPVLMIQDGMINIEADCLISYATVGGHTAMRSQSEGSWYITDLCRALQDYAHIHSIKYALRKTRESLKNRVEHTQLSEDKETLLKGVQLQRADLDNFVNGITDLVEMEVKNIVIDKALEDIMEEIYKTTTSNDG